MTFDNTVFQFVQRWLSWIGRHEAVLLLLLAAVSGGIWLFAEIADEVLEGETQTLDKQILMMMRNPNDLSDPVGPRWFEEMMRDFTALGGIGVLAIVTAAVTGFLFLQQKFRAAAIVILASGGSLAVSLILKMLFERTRPDLVPHGSIVYTASFPSGHSMMAAAVYLTLGAMLARVQEQWRLKAFVLILAALLTLGVGVSRVYLGVHWPTDVLAGWTAGATWALLFWVFVSWLQRTGHMEEPHQTTEDLEKAIVKNDLT